MAAYFSALKLSALLNSCPGAIAQGLMWGIMALGVYLTFRMLSVSDLTVDGSFATGGAVMIMLVLGGWNPQLALLMAFLSGCIAGYVTGLLHTKLGIPAILAGILTQISLYSVNLTIMGKANQAVNVNKVVFLLTSNSNYLTRTILIMLFLCAVVIALFYCYLGTEHGCALRATGNNDKMARAQGINTSSMVRVGLTLANGFVALAGGMVSQYNGYADVNSGRGAIVIGLAAVIIGEVLGQAICGKRLNFVLRLMFVVIGSIVYYLVYAFVIWLKFPSGLMKLLTATVVAIFLAVPYLQNQAKTSFGRVARENAKAAKEG